MEPVRHQGELTGGTHEQRVVRLAGALAESGIAALELEVGDVKLNLRARQTDLPGQLLGLPTGAGTLRAGRDLQVMISRASIVWFTTNAALADRLRRAQD